MVKILLVDDEPEVADSLQMMLQENCRYELEIDVKNIPRRAIELAEQKVYDILISDMRMPEMTGLQMAEKITDMEHNKNIQIIFLTGFEDFETLYKVNRKRNTQYLLKNEEDEEVVEAVEFAIQQLPSERRLLRSLDDDENSLQVVQQAREYIQNNLSKDLSLIMISQYVNMNPSYFSRMFKQKTGENISDYIHRLRIEKAKELIENSTMKIAEIGESLGFGSAGYFTTYFKKATGSTPQGYRNMCQLRKMKKGAPG